MTTLQHLLNTSFTMSITSIFADKTSFKARAILAGERIDLRSLETTDRLAVAPLVVSAGDHGCAVLFRYGAVVLFNLSPLEEVTFLKHLGPLITDAFAEPETPETEETAIRTDQERDGIVESGAISLSRLTLERLQVIATILARSVALAYYEKKVSAAFERIEPLADDLQRKGTFGRQARGLLRHIGDTLLIQHKMVGRVEISEKPELLWEQPDLERFYLRLEDEYELRERDVALGRKLELISRTAETILDLLQNSRSLRVEWYIVILIVAEILLTLYKMF